MLWMRGRTYNDERMFLGIVTKRMLMLMLIGLVTFFGGGVPVLVSPVIILQPICLYVFISSKIVLPTVYTICAMEYICHM